jgi:1,4-dihydroxy-2-naphthoate octaprenyltransferase
VSPVIAASGLAFFEHGFSLLIAALALLVCVGLQVGVNYANDYSDGVRGTDAVRVGPVRLVGSGLAEPGAVKRAAFAGFALAAIAGLVVVIMTGLWWLVAVGAASVLAAWYYPGGKRPYGYRGLGEVFVFVFFGLVATAGTTYVLVERVTWLSVAAAVPVGLLATSLLAVNNLRDIPTDALAGKRTLAVRLGDRRARWLYVLLLLGAFVVAVLVAGLSGRPLAVFAIGAVSFARSPAERVLGGAQGPALIPVLGDTGRLQLVFGFGFALGLWLGGLG